MSRYSFAFLQAISEHLSVDDTGVDIDLVERGYLYMATPAERDGLLANHAIQRQSGVEVELLQPAELDRKFPWLASGDLAVASLGLSGEGWFDGYGVLQAFKRRARSLGVAYVTGEVVSLDSGPRRVNAVVLDDGKRIACGNLVNAAGPHARSIAVMAGVELPVFPEKHCVFVFDCRDPPPDSPMLIDPSGVYCRPEGTHFIAGAARREGEVIDNTSLDVDYTLFDDVVWPRLAARVAAFEQIRLVNAWAGYYELNSFDHNALLGAGPEVPNLYFANGFSGHGMQHAPAAGIAVAEIMLFGEYRTLDVGALSYTRYLEREPIRETNVI